MVVRYPRLNVIFSDHHTATHRPAPPAAPPAASATTPATTLAAAPGRPARSAQQRVVVDQTFRTATVEGRQLELTYLEFELLAHLVANPLRVHSRGQLMEAVWERPDNGDTRTINTHIARLRRKLGPDHRASIATVRQIGYKYDPSLAFVAA
ncbi:winged helix-turn-helix domain-containing protein [Kitasatospora sp. HPMI-4]|uniref:winged helix-turn-helix domain-containing protein n=1 Tax=Kitasatospora sp. HPMI-4 TaxID=3448443 RepID=UPI003F1C2860